MEGNRRLLTPLNVSPSKNTLGSRALGGGPCGGSGFLDSIAKPAPAAAPPKCFSCFSVSPARPPGPCRRAFGVSARVKSGAVRVRAALGLETETAKSEKTGERARKPGGSDWKFCLSPRGGPGRKNVKKITIQTLPLRAVSFKLDSKQRGHGPSHTARRPYSKRGRPERKRQGERWKQETWRLVPPRHRGDRRTRNRGRRTPAGWAERPVPAAGRTRRSGAAGGGAGDRSAEFLLHDQRAGKRRCGHLWGAQPGHFQRPAFQGALCAAGAQGGYDHPRFPHRV